MPEQATDTSQCSATPSYAASASTHHPRKTIASNFTTSVKFAGITRICSLHDITQVLNFWPLTALRQKVTYSTDSQFC